MAIKKGHYAALTLLLFRRRRRDFGIVTIAVQWRSLSVGRSCQSATIPARSHQVVEFIQTFASNRRHRPYWWMRCRERMMSDPPSHSVWRDAALVLVREHGSKAVDYCIRRMHELIENGQEKEALAWIEIAFATAEIVAEAKCKSASE